MKTTEYAPALVNLGNLRLRANLAREALAFFERAAAVSPHDSAVLLGLARSHNELQDYELARKAYEELLAASPQLAAQFSYLRFQGDVAAWMAKENGVKDIMVWEKRNEKDALGCHRESFVHPHALAPGNGAYGVHCGNGHSHDCSPLRFLQGQRDFS